MGKKGFTLIEILIALVILLVGLVGILALYPVGISNTKESAEDSTIGKIAHDIHERLQVAMRMAPPGGPVEAILPGVPTENEVLKFPLPPAPPVGQEVSPWYVFPSKNQHILGSSVNVGEFPGSNTGGNVGWVYDYCANKEGYIHKLHETHKKFDQSDITCQYSYSFDVRRKGQEPLYEFRLKIYRKFDDWAPSVKPDNIKFTTFHFYLAGNGG